MRTRSRMLSKRRLQLPTIREGAEETLRDMNPANHVQPQTSDDYFLSICHLASPTFPTQDPAPDIISARRMEALHQRLQHAGSQSVTLEVHHREKEEHVSHFQQGEREDVDGHHRNSDPLEYLYGHQSTPSADGTVRSCGGVWGRQARSRAFSVPRASSPDCPRQRKSSCPELPTSSGSTPSDLLPKHSPAQLEARTGGPRVRDSEVQGQGPALKHSLISGWFSDCRSAWREARVRACMLPAIAEL